MFAFMNSDALRLSISTGLAHYWSRSRQKLWKKGETSGMFQHIDRIRIDDDQDCLILEVKLILLSILNEFSRFNRLLFDVCGLSLMFVRSIFH